MKKKNSTIKRITPNEGQAEAIDLIKKFLKDKKSTEFCLNGSAGTGKTTIIKEVFLKVNKQGETYLNHSVIGCTVSHKARLVLSEHIPNSLTYAAGVNMQIDFDPWGEMIFVPKYGEFRESKLYGFKYIIVDEASMFSQEMREVLLMSASPKSKIIYLGDNKQLPPIKSDQSKSKYKYIPDQDSPVFDLDNKYTLTQKMRQSDDDVIAHLADMVGDEINNGQSLSFIAKIKNNYNKETQKGYSLSHDNAVIKSFVSNYNDGKSIKITAYTNKRVDYLNDEVRKLLFPDGYKKKYVPGDLIVGNDLYQPNGDVVFYNGEDMIVTDCIDTKVLDLNCYMLFVKHKDSPIYVVKEDSMPAYKKRISELKAEALKLKIWSSYMSYKNNFANISYSYAVTLYKVQGSTMYGTYVDVHDIMGVKPLTNKRKLQAMYTGFTRPTNFLAIF